MVKKEFILKAIESVDFDEEFSTLVESMVDEVAGYLDDEEFEAKYERYLSLEEEDIDNVVDWFLWKATNTVWDKYSSVLKYMEELMDEAKSEFLDVLRRAIADGVEKELALGQRNNAPYLQELGNILYHVVGSTEAYVENAVDIDQLFEHAVAEWDLDNDEYEDENLMFVLEEARSEIQGDLHGLLENLYQALGDFQGADVGGIPEVMLRAQDFIDEEINTVVETVKDLSYAEGVATILLHKAEESSFFTDVELELLHDISADITSTLDEVYID